MDTATLVISLIVRVTDRAGVRTAHLVLLGLVTIALAFGVGVLAADLLVPGSDPVLVAPFRW
jgi:hypothetical protein